MLGSICDSIQFIFYLAHFPAYLVIEVLCVSIVSLGVIFCSDNGKFVLVQVAINVATDIHVLCLSQSSCSYNLRYAVRSKSFFFHDGIRVSLCKSDGMSILC